MKADTFRMHTPEPQETPSSPSFQGVSMPTPAGSLSPTEGTFFLRCGAVVPSVSLSPSSSALASRRANSRPQTGQGQIDLQQPTTCRYGRCPDQIYGQSLTPPLDAMEILSPTVIAARDYYLSLDHRNIKTPPHSSSEIDTLQRRTHPALRNITQALSTPRRHSVALELYPDGLEKIKDIKLRTLELSRRGSATPTSGNSERASGDRVPRSRERWLQKVLKDEKNPGLELLPFLSQSGSTESLGVPTGVQQQIHNPLDPRYLGNIPFSYTTSKLREWGNVYLFNSATADAFIRAIPMPSSGPSKIRPSSYSEDLHRSLSDFSLSDRQVKDEPDLRVPEPPAAKQLVKVRIIPHCKTRKSFFMQKAFPIRKSPTLPSYRVTKHGSSTHYHLQRHRERYQGTKIEVLRDELTGIEYHPRLAVPIR